MLTAQCLDTSYLVRPVMRSMYSPRVRPIEVVCSHVDYLYEHADEITSSQQWRRELSQLKEECDAVPER